ncbi:hypothetical protein BAUCODRAFT_38652 [Baudoinia panamericana UAMH 10762]|uniref:Tuberous sclerosis 1 protein n=1 Tax=Baudoinia panamericana (strain UAMH 10762) TaxID=717646 RepID=M2MZ06_BAUPA|nr:uncharacterized protein BAUCODRAFT_38652 [Baudoinia panamericana UAMH 10762]EMC91540.1 hypothetical protein BAUCODRAFT_38652 [Baudoinia panamericana UAMH 10762]
MSARTIKDAIRALQAQFSAPKIPLSLPAESRRLLQGFVEEHEGTISEDESSHANVELKTFWERYVGDNRAKYGAFVGVLRELRPVIRDDTDLFGWWQLVVEPVLTTPGRKAALEDAREFLLSVMVNSDHESPGQQRSKVSTRLMTDLLKIYQARTRGVTDEDPLIAPENAQIAQQVEVVLVSYGRRQPKEFFHRIDDLILFSDKRIQGLTLLNSFLRYQTPHLYLVNDTPLVEDILKCLMNDTSVTVLSVALNALIMLLPHIPGQLGPHLPRLFLVYSRFLCWERFSPLSTEAQRDTVTDDRVPSGSLDDHRDIGIEHAWEVARPEEDTVETSPPELLTYFTYLYGMYPLNFMSYIRKPRRYLKDIDFPGADLFDLDQGVIRARSEQYRQVHLLHPNFYNHVIDEEFADPKWTQADPADVVAECTSLCVSAKLSSLPSPGPPPTGKLPHVPSLPSLANKFPPPLSPSPSHASFRSGNSWRDTQSTAVAASVDDGDSPNRPSGMQSEDESVLSLPRSRHRPSRASPSLDDFPHPSNISYVLPSKDREESPPQTNLTYLQRENTLLRNDLNFERWHKAQYSVHIGQLMRKNVKDATAEAETLNLINANRALKVQLDQLRNAREATVKDSALTRKQTTNLEANLTERFMQMRKEQETWRADAEELKRLRKEIGQYRDVLLATEERELAKTHRLEIVKRELENLQNIDQELHQAKTKIREYEYHEFEMNQAKRELEILQHEKEALQMRVQRFQHENERTRRAYADKVAELEAQYETGESIPRRGATQTPGPDVQTVVQQAIAESQAKLSQLRKKHTALMERYSDLEMEYESVKAQLDAVLGNSRPGGSKPSYLQGGDDDSYDFTASEHGMSGALGQRDGARSTMGDFNAFSDNAYISSASEPSKRHYHRNIDGVIPGSSNDIGGLMASPPIGGLMPASPSASDAVLHREAGLTWKPTPAGNSRKDSLASRGSSALGVTFNQTAPLREEELGKVRSKGGSSEASLEEKRKAKIKPDSEVRVYGRGGAQNIKMKPGKEKDRDGAESKAEKKVFRGLRNLV